MPQERQEALEATQHVLPDEEESGTELASDDEPAVLANDKFALLHPMGSPALAAEFIAYLERKGLRVRLRKEP